MYFLDVWTKVTGCLCRKVSSDQIAEEFTKLQSVKRHLAWCFRARQGSVPVLTVNVGVVAEKTWVGKGRPGQAVPIAWWWWRCDRGIAGGMKKESENSRWKVTYLVTRRHGGVGRETSRKFDGLRIKDNSNWHQNRGSKGDANNLHCWELTVSSVILTPFHGWSYLICTITTPSIQHGRRYC